MFYARRQNEPLCLSASADKTRREQKRQDGRPRRFLFSLPPTHRKLLLQLSAPVAFLFKLLIQLLCASSLFGYALVKLPVGCRALGSQILYLAAHPRRFKQKPYQPRHNNQQCRRHREAHTGTCRTEKPGEPSTTSLSLDLGLPKLGNHVSRKRHPLALVCENQESLLEEFSPRERERPLSVGKPQVVLYLQELPVELVIFESTLLDLFLFFLRQLTQQVLDHQIIHK
jgi:hypothetical protein